MNGLCRVARFGACIFQLIHPALRIASTSSSAMRTTHWVPLDWAYLLSGQCRSNRNRPATGLKFGRTDQANYSGMDRKHRLSGKALSLGVPLSSFVAEISELSVHRRCPWLLPRITVINRQPARAGAHKGPWFSKPEGKGKRASDGPGFTSFNRHLRGRPG